jgi:hypothetical protein
MASLYVLGGRQKRKVLKMEREWYLYDRARVVQIDPESLDSHICMDYETPLEARADENASILFKAGTLRDGQLYLCTSTEVVVYQVPGFKRVAYVSLPCFNDLHHVCPTAGGSLLAVSTGLDMVVEFTLQGQIVRLWNVLGGDPWERFSPTVDYRKVASTKPHQSHPNFVFHLGDEIWVTRGQQRDAVCLTHPGRRIDIAVQFPHDGFVYNDKVYFTTVDGNIVIVDSATLRVEEIVDLKIINNERKALLGWCRGLMPLDERRFWVGFTRVRKTRFKENVLWVKHVFREIEMPTHIALYDLTARKCLQEIDLEKLGLNVVFGALPAAGP